MALPTIPDNLKTVLSTPDPAAPVAEIPAAPPAYRPSRAELLAMHDRLVQATRNVRERRHVLEHNRAPRRRYRGAGSS